MAYSETRIVMGGLVHIPILIFIANFFKGKFEVKPEEGKDTLVKEEKAKTIKELSNKLDNIEEKADKVYEKVKIKRKIRRRRKRKICKRINLNLS